MKRKVPMFYVCILVLLSFIFTTFGTVFAAIGKTNSSVGVSNKEYYLLVHKVDPYVDIHNNGTVSISKETIVKLGLTKDEKSKIKASMKDYNNRVLNHVINPSTHLAYNIKNDNINIQPLNTGGLTEGFFLSNDPQVWTLYFWWGEEAIYNERATQQLEGCLNSIGGGMTMVAACTIYIPFINNSVAMVAGIIGGGATFTAGVMQRLDNGYGIHIDYAAGYVPWYMSGNVVDHLASYTPPDPCATEVIVAGASSDSVLHNLQEFRDNVLGDNETGKKLIDHYYNISPYLVKEIIINTPFRNDLHDDIIGLQGLIQSCTASSHGKQISYKVSNKDIYKVKKLMNRVLPVLPQKLQDETLVIWNSMQFDRYVGITLQDAITEVKQPHSSIK